MKNIILNLNVPHTLLSEAQKSSVDSFLLRDRGKKSYVYYKTAKGRHFAVPYHGRTIGKTMRISKNTYYTMKNKYKFMVGW